MPAAWPRLTWSLRLTRSTAGVRTVAKKADTTSRARVWATFCTSQRPTTVARTRPIVAMMVRTGTGSRSDTGPIVPSTPRVHCGFHWDFDTRVRR